MKKSSFGWEGAASAVIGVLLIVSAIALGCDNMGLLIGESVVPETTASLERTIVRHPMVGRVVELLTRYSGAREVLVAARVELVDGLRSTQIADMSSEIDRQLRETNAEVTQVFIDFAVASERGGYRSSSRMRSAHREPSTMTCSSEGLLF